MRASKVALGRVNAVLRASTVDAEESYRTSAGPSACTSERQRKIQWQRRSGGELQPVAAWRDAFDGVRSNTLFRRKIQQQAVLDHIKSGAVSRHVRAFRQQSTARLVAWTLLLVANMALYVVDNRFRPKPDGVLLTIAAQTWARGGARQWLTLEANHLLNATNLTADGYVDFGDFNPLTPIYAVILALRGAAFVAFFVLLYAELRRNVASGVLVAVLISPTAQTLILNLLANVFLGGLVASMEWQYAGVVTWIRFVLSNGMHFLCFFMLMVTDAMKEKTKGLRRLWFFLAVRHEHRQFSREFAARVSNLNGASSPR